MHSTVFSNVGHTEKSWPIIYNVFPTVIKYEKKYTQLSWIDLKEK